MDICCVHSCVSWCRKSAESGPLSCIAWCFILTLQTHSISNATSWSLLRTRRYFKSIEAAVALAANGAIDVDSSLSKTYKRLLKICIHLNLVMDSKQLFKRLSTGRKPSDKCIHSEVVVVIFEFESRSASRIEWVSGGLSVADIETRFNNPLNNAVLHLLRSSTTPFDSENCDWRNPEHSPGWDMYILQTGVNTILQCVWNCSLKLW